MGTFSHIPVPRFCFSFSSCSRVPMLDLCWLFRTTFPLPKQLQLSLLSCTCVGLRRTLRLYQTQIPLLQLRNSSTLFSLPPRWPSPYHTFQMENVWRRVWCGVALATVWVSSDCHIIVYS